MLILRGIRSFDIHQWRIIFHYPALDEVVELSYLLISESSPEGQLTGKLTPRTMIRKQTYTKQVLFVP